MATKRKRRRKFAVIEWSKWSRSKPRKDFEDTIRVSVSSSPDGRYRIIKTVARETVEGETVYRERFFPMHLHKRVDFIDGEVATWVPVHWDCGEWNFRSLKRARLLCEAHSAYGKAGIKELYAARDRARLRARVSRQTK